MSTRNGKAHRGVYSVASKDAPYLRYIGSSGCSLNKLESNHRNWLTLYKQEGWTNFREVLVREGQNWKFSWLIEPYLCELYEIEHAEGSLIRALHPLLNIDKDPVASSVKRRRYVLPLDFYSKTY